MQASKWRRWLTAAALLQFGACGFAHDSWLRVAAVQPEAGLLELELGNGARYPRSEYPTARERVAGAGCASASGSEQPLRPRHEEGSWLALRARVAAGAPVACWVELRPQDIELTADLVETYLHDIRAPQAVRDAWARQRQAGQPWKEVYRKYIRIEAPPVADGVGADLSALRRPRGFPLELVPVGTRAVRPGSAAEFVALSGGLPVAGLAVEFVSRRSPVGVWRETDAQGRVALALPYAGEWLLRGTIIDVPTTPQQSWRSRFATLTVVAQ